MFIDYAEGSNSTAFPYTFTTLDLALVIGIPCLTLLICCLTLVCCCLKCANMRQRMAVAMYAKGIIPERGWGGFKPPKKHDNEYNDCPDFPVTSFAATNHYMDIHALAKHNKSDYWELDPQNVIIHESVVLGNGAFAYVYKGTVKGKIPLLKAQSGVSVILEHSNNGSSETAVKRLPAHADEQNRVDFFHEIDFMKRLGYHVHIIAMLGCVSDPRDPLVVVEYCHHGDLLKLLRDNRQTALLSNESPSNSSSINIRMKDLVSFAWQISDGMSYLASKNFIHRDLAARNVLITKNFVAKVSDFGLCRYVDSSLYTAKGGKLPIKWMSIESLKFYEYSTKSDVWAYGVTLFEIFSLGEGPYQSIQPIDMLAHLEMGNRLKQPEKCPNEIYSVMSKCWQASAADRPTFDELKGQMAILLNIDDDKYGYLDVHEDGIHPDILSNMPQEVVVVSTSSNERKTNAKNSFRQREFSSEDELLEASVNNNKTREDHVSKDEEREVSTVIDDIQL